MYYNRFNYGSIESFSRHSGIPLNALNHILETSKENYEVALATFLGLKYSPKLMFIHGKPFYRASDISDYIGISPQACNKSIRAGKTLDEILNPDRLRQLNGRHSNINVSSSGENVVTTKRELLSQFNLSTSDVEVLKRVLHLKTTSDVINFVRYHRMRNQQ